MADIVPSLFGLTPGMYQQAQQQRGDEMALQYAKLDPFQQANYAIGRGAYGLAGAAGGLLGGQDPELQRITRRQQIASQVDFTNPKSIQEGITLLGDDIMGKQQLAAIYRQQLESGALVGQREAAALASRAAATTSAAEASDIANQQKAFAALTGDQVPTAPAIPAAAAPTPAMIDQATGAMTYAIPPQTEISGTALPSVTEQARPTVATKPNINQQISELEKRRSQLLSLPKVPAAKAQAEVLGDQIKALREQGKPVVVGNTLVNSSTGTVIYQGDKPEKYSAFAQELIDAGLTPGTGPFQKRMLEYVSEKAKGAAKGTGNVTFGNITLDTGEAAKAAGKVVGANLANVENQYSLQTAFKDAINLVDQGIYGGAYGPEKQFVAKFTGIGSPKKVENTEVFLANIGEIVIPRLQQFGGNDSNEELKYLQKVVAGDQRLEPAAVKRILASAEQKVQNNIKRLLKQKEGGALPTEPMTPAPAATPKATMRYNPQTRKLEPIAGN